MADLTSFEPGIRSIETARLNALELTPAGDEVTVRSLNTETDKQQITLVLETLKRNREAIIAITSHPENIRKALSEAQQGLIEGLERHLLHMDLWHRLEKAYRYVFPDDIRCVMGESKCPDDSIVFCAVCAEKRGKDVV